MRKLTSILLSIVISLSSLSTAFAWGPDGHKTVGQIASLRINQTTQQKIAAILKSGETLASISTWADTVKDRMGQSDPDKDTRAFLKDKVHNGNNASWHFDDLPLGCNRYDTCNGFTTLTDVVHMINVCITTLQGQSVPGHPLSKRNALRLLVHFVGDLHQPMHVASGYINEHGPGNTILIVSDPSQINDGIKKDVGGNVLIIDKTTEKNLHSFWDGDLVHLMMDSSNTNTIAAFAQLLKTTITPQPDWDPQGPITTWAAQWATDSLHQSRDHSYNSVVIVRKFKLKKGKNKGKFAYEITRDENYDQTNTPVVGTQLAKGGYRLAALLDEIFK
ncbi:MAG: hypothetical protein C5B55_00635 [Blastocatellia bacterium]|nr:MAG: hypothetical protein C5B55_00635 [Blastocatellia bacterium]